jgi:rhodanese-related sulfurtransferase
MAPFDFSSIAGTFRYALIFGAIGFGFGYILEAAGFGDTRKLAAQFYLRDMTVLKVMFTAIVVAAVLLAGASSLGLLDMGRVFVNPTYLWPGIVGGLIMGVGFVVGGFCPGTSLVAAATLKVDGILFVLGALLGVGIFGETVSSFETFWVSSYMGRFTLPDWLGLSTGAVVVLVVAMALFMFWGAEKIERAFAAPAPEGTPVPAAGGRGKLVGAVVLAAAALAVAVHGEPSPDLRWAKAKPALHQLAEERGLFASPAEVVALKKDTNLKVELLDLRGEHDFNLFHVGGAERAEAASLEAGPALRHLLDRPASTVTFLVGEGEADALTAWKRLSALGVGNLYVVEGGIDHWLELYPVPECVAAREPGADGKPAWHFAFATGASLPSAWPELPTSHAFRFPCTPELASAEPEHVGHGGHGGFTWPAHTYTKRVKLQSKSVVKGGCG